MPTITFERVQHFIERKYEQYLLRPAYRLSMPSKIRKMRSKDKITVLFLISELGAWKTEELYCKMREHPRFHPILGITVSPENYNEFQPLLEYVKKKGYEYYNTQDYLNVHIWEYKPDIVFYQKPYDEAIHYSFNYRRHLNSLFCNVNYAPHMLIEKWAINQPLYNYLWQYYFENESVAEEHRKIKKNKKCITVTGVPCFDCLIKDKSEYPTPWKNQNKEKKKIIWAPHHTIPEMNTSGIAYSTFVDYCDYMLELAKKYKETTQWAFKPHPILKNKLYFIWGKDKTDCYYNEWASLENSQLETGEYIGLFKHSDAIIHDCSAFTVECHFTHNPILYLVRDNDEHIKNLTIYGRKAFDLHYKGYNKEDIEKFIVHVLNGEDKIKSERERFYNEYLLPPNGKTACENIIDAILYK